MATDSCGTERNTAAVGAAFLVTWGGVALAVIVAIAGVIVAALRGWIVWIWPTAALGLIVITVGIAVALLNMAVHPG